MQFIRRKNNHHEEVRACLRGPLDALTGGLVAGVAAALATIISGSYPWRAFVPLFFTLVLLLVAWMFGAHAGVIGTVLAAFIFAAFLFSPVGHLGVVDQVARANLAWMLLIGMAFSFLFAPPTSGLRRR